jgi:hypothetical protein
MYCNRYITKQWIQPVIPPRSSMNTAMDSWLSERCPTIMNQVPTETVAPLLSDSVITYVASVNRDAISFLCFKWFHLRHERWVMRDLDITPSIRSPSSQWEGESSRLKKNVKWNGVKRCLLSALGLEIHVYLVVGEVECNEQEWYPCKINWSNIFSRKFWEELNTLYTELCLNNTRI